MPLSIFVHSYSIGYSSSQTTGSTGDASLYYMSTPSMQSYFDASMVLLIIQFINAHHLLL